MKPIRILHIIGGLEPDGTERQLLELCRRLDRSRFEVSVLFYSSSPDSLADSFRESGVPLEMVDKPSLSSWKFLLELRRRITRLRPHVVHTWLYSANFWGRWAALTSGVPSVVASNRSLVVRRHAGRRLLERVSESLLARRTVRLANSLAVARSLERSYGLPVCHIRIIRNAVERPVCDRAAARREIRRELGVSEDRKLVLMVAREAAEKNYPMFLRVAKRLSEARPDVTCVGLGRRNLEGQLDALRDALGVVDSVRLVGYRWDVNRWLAAADVFCLTSNEEGSPNALLEAMMAGLPVVCTSFEGAEEVLPDASVGIRVARNDDRAMAGYVADLLEHDEWRRGLGRAAQEWVLANYSWSRLVAEMETFYCTLATAGMPVTRSNAAHQS
jgi:glycosyltransferase involved in cell wall biosynthesis